MGDIQALQQGLAPAWRCSRPSSEGDHVRIVLPSYSVGTSALAHYAHRLPALEHRFLVEILRLARPGAGELLFVFCQEPDDAILEYYLSLLPKPSADSARRRVRTVVVPDASGRAIAAKLLDRPDLMEQIRRYVGGRPAFIEPWNVTEDEVAVSLGIRAPVYGTMPSLWPLAFKSSGRKLFAAAGVPTPAGAEDVRSVNEVEGAIARLRLQDPRLEAVVIKLDNSVAGDGNVVVPIHDADGLPCPPAVIAERLHALPTWFAEELELGGVVEARISGEFWSSPSVQVEISPEGETEILATHEQLLGGENGQVYMGCAFPARRDYAARLMSYGRQVGEALAASGAVGMLSVDFVAARDRGLPWRLYALEVNLRRGGTTPPIVVLSSLLPGRYDRCGRWRLADGSARYYRATDNLVEPRWVGLPPARVISAIESARLGFDRRTGTGVVLHMLSGLAIDGRFGLTAVGASPREATRIFAGVRPAVDRAHAAWSQGERVSRRTSQIPQLSY